MVHIRSCRPDDHDAVYDVCVRTGASGRDARELIGDPDLLGHVYAGPYLALAPQLAFVVEDDAGVAGYLLGVADTAAFEARVEREWWPQLRRRYPVWRTGADARFDDMLIAFIHSPVPRPAEVVAEYPAHLHIDLLPRLQRQGWGRKLVDTLVEELRTAGLAGLHLGVARGNTDAQAFYRAIGFTELRGDDSTLTFVRRL